MNWPGLISIIVFYLVILGVGIFAAWWQKRKAKKEGGSGETTEGDAAELLLANRDINIFVGVITLTATWVGGGYINGSAEVVYTDGYGLLWCQAPVGYALSLCVGALLFAGPMRRNGYVTMLDPLHYKFGEVMCGFLFIPAYLGEVFWSAAILSALGSTLTVILQLHNTISIIVSACIALGYSMFGGLVSVSYTDVVQLFCIFVGLWISIPFAMSHEAVSPIAETAFSGNLYTNGTWLGAIDPNDAGTYIDTGLMLVFGGVAWQVYFQRVLAMPTARRAQVLSLAAGAGCIIMVVPAVLIGAIGFSTDWSRTGWNGTAPLAGDEIKLVLPLVMQYLCPTVISFFGLGAVSAAVMSSADSSLLSASSLLARNVVKAICWQKASDRQMNWVIRGGMLITCVISVVVALTVNSIYGLWFLCSDLVYVVLFPQLLCAVHLPISNTYGSVSGYLVGLALRLTSGEALLNLPAAIEYPGYVNTPGAFYQRTPTRLLAMLANLAAIIVVSVITDYLFRGKILPKKADIFKCVVNLETPRSIQRPENRKQKTEDTEIPAYNDDHITRNGNTLENQRTKGVRNQAYIDNDYETVTQL